MKKGIIVILVLAIVLGLCACGGSAASNSAKKVEQKIAEIGEVTKSSDTAIQEAREAYSALEEEAKSNVANIAVLEEAEKTYDQIVVTEVENLINQIEVPEIGVDNETAEGLIEEAKTAYDSLTEKQQEMVSNIDTLVHAEAVVSSPYGIPLYDSPEDVDLATVFAGHSLKRIVDLFGGIYRTESVIRKQYTMYVQEYDFLDNEHWDEPQYVYYDTKGCNDPDRIDGFDFFVRNASLYNGDPYNYCDNYGTAHKLSVPADILESKLDLPFMTSVLCDPSYEYTITSAEVIDGKYVIHFDVASDSADTSKHTGRYVEIDPATSLICGYGYEDADGSGKYITDNIQYGLDELPNYDKARKSVFG